MSIHTLLRQVTTRLNGLKYQQLEREAAVIWEEWTNEGLLQTLMLIGEDGTLPADFDKRVAAIDRDIANRQTEEEKAAIALFETRYAGEFERAKDELLAQLANNN